MFREYVQLNRRELGLRPQLAELADPARHAPATRAGFWQTHARVPSDWCGCGLC